MWNPGKHGTPQSFQLELKVKSSNREGNTNNCQREISHKNRRTRRYWRENKKEKRIPQKEEKICKKAYCNLQGKI